MTNPEPARYRTTNWKSYNDALKRRGSLLVWLERDMAWLAPKCGKLGRLALCGAVLAEHPAGPAFGDAECLAHMLHAFAAARRA